MVPQPLEEVVLTADHTSECSVYFSAGLGAELSEGAVWEQQTWEGSWVGKAGGYMEILKSLLLWHLLSC